MNERGSLLITAVWAVMFLSILAAGLGAHAQEQMLLMRRELISFRDRRSFASGLQAAAALIGQDPMPHEDSKDEPWYGKVKDGVYVEDEESKLNLNHASAAFLAEFLKEFEDEEGPLKGQRKEYVKAILKLRYEKQIDCLEELLLLEEFSAEDLPRLRKYFTVYPELPFINPNTASPLILRSLVASLSGEHASKQMLAGRLNEACRGKACFFLSHELEPEKLAEKLKLPKTLLVMQVLQQFVTTLTTDSETFRIAMSSKEAEAWGVFRRRVGQHRPEVLYWHEKI